MPRQTSSENSVLWIQELLAQGWWGSVAVRGLTDALPAAAPTLSCNPAPPAESYERASDFTGLE